MALALLLMVGLGFSCVFSSAGLGPIANDPLTRNSFPGPNGITLPMFEWLQSTGKARRWCSRSFVIPGLLAALLFLMPFLDRKA